jgi:hypothetical protein
MYTSLPLFHQRRGSFGSFGVLSDFYRRIRYGWSWGTTIAVLWTILVSPPILLWFLFCFGAWGWLLLLIPLVIISLSIYLGEWAWTLVFSPLIIVPAMIYFHTWGWVIIGSPLIIVPLVICFTLCKSLTCKNDWIWLIQPNSLQRPSGAFKRPYAIKAFKILVLLNLINSDY